MAQFNDDDAPPGYRYVYSGDPSGGGVRYLEPIADRSIPQATPQGEFIPTPPSENQLRLEQEQQAKQQSLADFLLNYPTELRDQAMALGETGATFLGGLTSPVAASIAALGKNAYDFVTQGQVDPKATKDFANEAARLFSYRPVTPSAQSALETMSEVPEYFLGTSQGLPPVVSGINPRALQTAPVLGSLSAGIKRDVSQFSNDVFNAQRGITPGYPTLGSEFSSAFVTPKPTIYELLAGLEPSRLPSTVSAAVKPVGKGNTAYSFGEPIPSLKNRSEMTDYLSNQFKWPRALDDANTQNSVERHKVLFERLNPNISADVALIDYITKNKTIEERQSFKRADVPRLYNEFIEKWNASNPANKVPTVEQFVAANKAFNEWNLGPGKTYIERLLGTGAATDPVLAEIEKTGLNIFPDIHISGTKDAGRESRTYARNIHALNPAFVPGVVGEQTATTVPGQIYENIADAFIVPQVASRVKQDYSRQRGESISDEAMNRLNAIPEHEVIYDVNQEGFNPLEPLQTRLYNALLSGEIKPENISNVSVQRLVQMLYKDEQDKLKALQKDKDAYAKYRKAFFDRVPEEMVEKTFDDGSKIIRFDKNTPLSKDVLVRALCMDTKDLNHCVAAGGHNVGDYKGYVPLVEPHTGKPPRGVGADQSTSFIDEIENGRHSIYSYRDKDGKPIATIQAVNEGDGRISIPQIMSTDDKAIVNADDAKRVREWLNSKQDEIASISTKFGVNHVGRPFDLTRKKEAEVITDRHPDIDPEGLRYLFETANMNAAMNLDFDFANWYSKTTGRNFEDDFPHEPFSNLLEAGSIGLSDDFDMLTETLGDQTSSPEYLKFVRRALEINDGQGILQEIGRFVTKKDLEDYAKIYDESLKYPEIDIATASKKDLNAYFRRLDNERSQANISNDHDEAVHIMRRMDEVAARLEEIRLEETAKTREIVDSVLGDIVNDPMSVVPRLTPLTREYRSLIDNLMDNQVVDFTTGPMLEQMNILRGPVEGNVLTGEQQQAIRRWLLKDTATDSLAYAISRVRDSKDAFNPERGATPEQAAQAAQIIANWVKYRLENPEPEKYVASPLTQRPMEQADDIRRELGLPDEDADRLAIPNMDWDRADALRNFWLDYQLNRVMNIDAVPEDMYRSISTLLGNQAENAILPREIGWSIVRTLANPETTVNDIRILFERVRDRTGEFGPLMPGQRENAMNIINEWINVNGIEGFAQGGRVRRMAKGGSVKMQDGGKPDDDIMSLKPQAKDLPPTVGELIAEIGSGKQKLNPNAAELLQTANKTPDPVRYFETLNPYTDSRISFNTGYNAFGRPNIGGYVDTREPNIANIVNLRGIENTVPHELEHTLQLQKGKDQQFQGKPFNDVGYAQTVFDRLNAMPEEQRKLIAQGANVARHPDELLANIAAYSALSHAKGIDFINTPEGKALFPDAEGQSYYYNAILPNVRSIYGYRENAGTQKYVNDPRDSYATQAVGFLKNKATELLNRADGGAVNNTLDKMVKNPQAATMLNLDLPNLVASRQQTKTLRRGGRVQFAHDLDQMRYEMTHRRG